jgi:hypothetical protein
MNKLIMTLILGLFLLDYVNDLPYPSLPQRPRKSKIEKKMRKISRQFKKLADNKAHAKVIISMIFGLKRGLSKSIKSKFKRLNLLHLFTPSGLHFSSLLLFLLPLINLSRYCHLKLPKLLIIMLCLLPFALVKFYSLKRIALLKILTLLFGKYLSIYKLFLITFILDFIFGSFQQSPLSFSYSFIFLGILLSFSKINFKLLLGLFTGQLILAMFLKEEINLLGPFLGFIITSLFSFSFPILLLLFSLFKLIGTFPAEILLAVFLKLIYFAIQLTSWIPDFKVHFGIILAMLVILSTLGTRVKSRLILLGLILFL